MIFEIAWCIMSDKEMGVSKMTKQEIGQILRAAREAKGLTQKQVAEAMGRKQQVVGHWETGYSQPDANTLFELCDLYGLSIDDAFGKKKSENVDVLYISRPSGDGTTDELRKQLHDYIDSLSDDELRAMSVMFKIERT